MEMPGFLQQHANKIYIGLIAVFLVIFFNEAFFAGKVFNVPDNLSAIVFEEGYLKKADEAGVNAFWNPYIFGGMPTWGSSIPGHGLYIHTFLDPLSPKLFLQIYSVAQDIVNVLPLPAPFWDIFNYFLLGLFTYMFGIRKKFPPHVAFLVAFSVVFSLYSLNWIMAGHNTKITVFSLIPAALLLIDMLYERRSILNVALFVVVLHLMFNSGHVQMVFYAAVAMGLYILYKLYEGESVKVTLYVAGITIGASVFAFLMLSGPYFATWEYKDFSIRGAGSGGSGHSAPGGGLDYDYATNWSFSPMEVITFWVPSFAGWGTPTYWGTMPFTESPIYLGVVISFLALLGIILRPKDKFVHFWIALGVVSLLISLGRNFGALYDLLFYNLPFFNNFRIPSMILFLNGLCIAMLAGIGLTELIKRMQEGTFRKEIGEKKVTKAVWIPVGAAALLVVILLASGSSYKESVAEGMAKHQPSSWNLMQQVEQAFAAGQGAQIPPDYQDITREAIYDMAVEDALIALLFMAVAGGLIWGFAKGKVGLFPLILGLFVILIIDWWRIDFKPMHMQPERVQQNQLQPTDVVRFLQQDESTFRILPANDHAGDNWYVGFGIQSVAGYHPAKMRLYDDIRNTIFNEFRFANGEHLSRTNWALLSMMNTKYVVVPNAQEWALQAPWLQLVFQGQQKSVYQNNYVLPRAFFVGRHEVIENDSLMLQKISNPAEYQPQMVAYLSEPLDRELPNVSDSALAFSEAELTDFNINSFSYTLETPVDAILKISENYYPSGWTATLDGKPIEILRTDYSFRAVVIPAGSHTLRMEFVPETYTAGLIVTFVTNYLLVGVLIYFGVLYIRRQLKARQRNTAQKSE